MFLIIKNLFIFLDNFFHRFTDIPDWADKSGCKFPHWVQIKWFIFGIDIRTIMSNFVASRPVDKYNRYSTFNYMYVFFAIFWILKKHKIPQLKNGTPEKDKKCLKMFRTIDFINNVLRHESSIYMHKKVIAHNRFYRFQ